MQKTMEPNGLTLESYLNSFGMHKPMGLHMHSSAKAHGLDCFATPNQCEDPCSYKKELYTISSKQRPSTPHLWQLQSCTDSTPISFCTFFAGII